MKKENVDIQIFSKMINSSFYGSLHSKVQEMAKEHKRRPKREQEKLEANGSVELPQPKKIQDPEWCFQFFDNCLSIPGQRT
mgnify:CR=1 FL=1